MGGCAHRRIASLHIENQTIEVVLVCGEKFLVQSEQSIPYILAVSQIVVYFSTLFLAWIDPILKHQLVLHSSLDFGESLYLLAFIPPLEMVGFPDRLS